MPDLSTNSHQKHDLFFKFRKFSPLNSQKETIKIPEYWSPDQVYNYLSRRNGERLVLPENVYCTKDFTWNEVLMTKTRNISLPDIFILKNLQKIVDVLQKYRTELDVPITITSGWRTPEEQKMLIKLYNSGKLKNKPSETSLHSEGLALDVTVPVYAKGKQQKLIYKGCNR